MISWFAAMGYGAVGGLVVEAVFTGRRLQEWQQARHAAVTDGSLSPAITKFIDLRPDMAVALSRAVLGCVAGWVLHAEVTGMYAALTVGASAPALLANLGKAATPSEALQGGQGHGEVPQPGPTLTRPPEAQPEAVE